MVRQVILGHHNGHNGKKPKGNNIKMESFFQAKRAEDIPSKAVETDTACDII